MTGGWPQKGRAGSAVTPCMVGWLYVPAGTPGLCPPSLYGRYATF